ncbi:hypothetical protein NDU88_003348 [Pleurodeles waltl]|uniref:Uncharacterized protein n=1 Tax=Pleurodeles waltl TaxID=8319 RepID=A0AAV7MQA9_PLEWA|nr:hypothetical protein NDU88_003348 [Pleurodeles waltl]
MCHQPTSSTLQGPPAPHCTTGPPAASQKALPAQLTTGSSQLLPMRQPDPAGRGRSITGVPASNSAAGQPRAQQPCRREQKIAGGSPLAYLPCTCRLSPPGPASKARKAHGRALRASRLARPSPLPPVRHSRGRGATFAAHRRQHLSLCSAAWQKRQKNLRPDRRNIKSVPQDEKSRAKCRPSCCRLAPPPHPSCL